MANVLSKEAQQFLRGDHVGVVGTLNRDGNPHLVTIWYSFTDDGTLVMNTPIGTQKVKNLRRNPRIALCVGDASRSVSLYGTVSIIEDQATIRQDLDRLIKRYVKDENVQPQVMQALIRQPRVSLHFKPDKVTEFTAMG